MEIHHFRKLIRTLADGYKEGTMQADQYEIMEQPFRDQPAKQKYTEITITIRHDN